MSESIKLHVIETETALPVATDPTGDFKGHALGMGKLFRKGKEIDSRTLTSSWENTNKVIVMMINDAKEKETETGIKLDQIEVTLSVSGEGTVGFVSGKAEAGIVLTFKRS